MPWHVATVPSRTPLCYVVVWYEVAEWKLARHRRRRLLLHFNLFRCAILRKLRTATATKTKQQQQEKEEEEKVNKKKRKKNKQSERHAMRALCLLLLLLFDKKFSFVLCRDKNCDSWLWLECDNNYNTLLQLFYCQITNVFVFHIIFSTYKINFFCILLFDSLLIASFDCSLCR